VVSPNTKTRTGRRAGHSGTRDAILDAATKLFAERGYQGASMRTIAAAAAVDPALIRHFFSDKETLFATVVADRTTIFQQLAASLPGDPADIGTRAAHSYLQLWEQPQTRPILMAIARSAMTSDRAAQMLRDALAESVRAHLGEPDDNQSQLLALAGSQLFGLAIARHIIKVPAITQLALDDLVAQVAPTIQRYLTATHLEKPGAGHVSGTYREPHERE
jgi:AcrR family transcriptional regulator